MSIQTRALLYTFLVVFGFIGLVFMGYMFPTALLYTVAVLFVTGSCTVFILILYEMILQTLKGHME